MVSSTYCWVSRSSRAGALITKSRSFSKASVCDASSRSACAADTITRVSSSRRCAGVSGVLSSSCWRTVNAWDRAALALFTAWVNGAVRRSPNSSMASASSLVLVRTALSTSTTIDRERSSRA
ncbi:Uncharacterised protein [Mycobacterium tuberculosis]|uniref:Uncharacterized protein n=1 Tax=Mycobacterium tuberculosis TaxID=1773 RepID=A0A0U0QUD1_MYCTX|nr:Uncharacterised protein [Mycobacterium tuberculosis]COW96840.1 Uncharacterised protein [Mycobacterium tuberculosis]COX36011.1 Uncharacterised protein [Mycobacterium tuberculosis]CPA30433.1 Uncharacterised protein [Mycobacterium tuberculosis]